MKIIEKLKIAKEPYKKKKKKKKYVKKKGMRVQESVLWGMSAYWQKL